jgi:hypothetical protein
MDKAVSFQLRIGLAVAFGVLSLGGTFASAGSDPNGFDPGNIDNVDSSTWENCYEANVLPVQDGWTDIDGHDPGGTNVGSIVPFDVGDPNGPSYLHVENDTDYQGFRWKDDPGSNAFDPGSNGGISIEWRMRAVSGNEPFFYHNFTSGAAQSRWVTTYVTTTAVSIRDFDTAGAQVSAPLDPNDTDFYIYRVTCDNSNWRLYRFTDLNDPDRGNPLLTATVSGAGAATDIVQLDFYGISPDAVYDIDYIRWTNYGALLPKLPENCGESGTVYKQTDLNTDCYVNEADLVQFLAEWLECTDPQGSGCDL